MVDGRPAPERRARALMGVVVASALVYPVLVSAVMLVLAQLAPTAATRVVGWLALGVASSIGVVAAVRWGAGRRVRSAWLLLGLAPPALFELWLVWPRLAS